MEQIDIEDNQKVEINASEIISKYKNVEDRKLFCYEKNWWHPNEKGFDATFFLKVISGEKKYLPNNFTIKNKMKCFKKGQKFDKKFIVEKMKGNEEYGKYVPDNCDPLKLSRDFLLTLMAFVDPNLYKTIFAEYKTEMQRRQHNRWGDYNVFIKTEFINDIRGFVPIANESNSKGGFRIYKNHQPTGVFKQFRNDDRNKMNQQQQKLLIINQQKKINDLQQQNQQNQNIIKNLQEHQQINLDNHQQKLQQNFNQKIEEFKLKENYLLNQVKELEEIKRVLKLTEEKLDIKLKNEKKLTEEMEKQKSINEELKNYIAKNAGNINDPSNNMMGINLKGQTNKKALEIKLSKK